MKKNKLNIIVTVLQNGSSVCQVIKKVSFGQKIKISPSLKGDLCIPFYPLPKEFVLLRVLKNEQVELDLTLPFTGVIKTKNQTIHLKDSGSLGQSYVLSEDNYASLNFRDLNFLIRLTRAPQIHAPPRRNPLYYTKLSSLIFRDRSEMFCGVAAIAISFFLFSCVMTGFLTRAPDKTKDIEGLERKYVLPFVSQSSLETLPEALKFNLDRNHYLRSLIRYYRSVMQLLNNWPIESSFYLFPSSIELFRKIHTQDDSRRLAIRQSQKIADQFTRSDANKRTLSIPSSIATSFQNNLLETIHKVDNMQLGFKLALESRRKFLSDFFDDPEYDWGNYLSSARKIDKKSAEALSKIVVFGQLNNERFMYDVGRRLGESANIIQRFYDRNRSQNDLLDTKSYRPVYIPAEAAFVSSSTDIDFATVDKKIGKIENKAPQLDTEIEL